MNRLFSTWSGKLLSGVLMLIVLPGMLVAGLFFSGQGLKIALWGAQKAVPQFEVARSEGTLLSGFSLYDVQFKDESLAVDARLKEVTLVFQPDCFLNPSVCIEQLTLDGLNVALKPPPSSSESADSEAEEPVSGISLPVPVQINNLELNNIALDIQGNKLSWEQFSSNADMSGSKLTVYSAKLNRVDLELAKAAEPEKSENQQAVTSSEKPVILPEIQIPLDIELRSFDLTGFVLKGDEPFVINQLLLTANAGGQDLHIGSLKLDMPLADLALSSDVTLSGDYPVSLKADAEIKQTELQGQKLALAVSGSVEKPELDATLSNLIESRITGNLKPFEADLPFDLSLTEGHLQFPLREDAEYVAEIDLVQLTGSLKNYRFNLDAGVTGETIPELDLTVSGKGDLNQAELEALTLKTLGGVVSGQAMANWQAPVNWSAELELSDIQPGLQWSEAEGKISGTVKTSGELQKSGGWQVQLPLLDIEGIVRDLPVDIHGSLEVADKDGKGDIHMNTQGLSVEHGPNVMKVNGTLNKEWNLDTRIAFADMEKSVPDLKGKLSGDLNIRGAFESPEVALNFTSENVGYQGKVSFSKADLTGDISLLPVPEGKLNLSVEHLEADGQVIDSIGVVFSGVQEKHGISLSLLSEAAKVYLHIDGALKQEPELMWQGKLTRAGVDTKQGPWKLNHPVNLAFFVREQMAKVESHCWSQSYSTLCFTKEIKAGKSGEIELSVKNFNFEQASVFMPEQLQLEGEVNAAGQLSWAPGKSPDGQVNVELSKGKVIISGEEKLELDWDSVAMNAGLHKDSLEADWQLDFTDNGTVKGNMRIPDVLAKDQILDANLNIDAITLEALQQILGEYSQLNAQIDSGIHISGSVMHPAVKGELRIHNIAAHGDITPLEVRQGNMNLLFNGYEATLDAELESADGVLNVEGSAGWQDIKDWYTNVNVYSEVLNVEYPPMVKVKIKPDMTISLSPELAKVEGDIYLPWGRIQVEELPESAVTVSSDEVILNKDLKPVQDDTHLPMAFQSDVKIHLGDDFKLSAFGLKSGLEGELKVTQKDKGPFVVGEVTLNEGVYRSFGQDLIIEEGKILMTGLVDQPYVRITAIRNPDNTQDDVIAGIRVSGLATNPDVEIYSDPVMPQQNALSYLLRGQDIDGKSGGNAMTMALIGVSLAKSGKMVGEIGEAFGVSDLQLDTTGSGDESQVTVSGYILPDLQVKYGVGIFDSFGEFTVRYRLMKDLYVEAVSGLDSAVDLLYQFEFD